MDNSWGEEGWTNCSDCGGRFKWTTAGQHRHRTLCWECVKFKVDLGPMDWRLFQRQRACLSELANSEHLSEEESEALQGIHNLLDHIVDEARRMGRNVPSLDEITLDRLAALD